MRKYAAVYIRRAVHGDINEILEQINDVMTFAMTLGTSDAKLFVDDNCSGSKLGTQFIRLLEEIESGKINNVIMRDISCISINTEAICKTVAFCDECNVKIEFLY